MRDALGPKPGIGTREQNQSTETGGIDPLWDFRPANMLVTAPGEGRHAKQRWSQIRESASILVVPLNRSPRMASTFHEIAPHILDWRDRSDVPYWAGPRAASVGAFSLAHVRRERLLDRSNHLFHVVDGKHGACEPVVS